MSEKAKDQLVQASRSRWDIARWVAAILVAVVAAVFYFYALDHQSICHGQALGEGTAKVVQVCGPPRLLELAPFALLIGVLLWPDLGELAVAGLFTLRRRVTAQEERQRTIEDRLLQVDQRLTQVAMQSQLQSQTAIGAVNNYYAPDQDDLKRSIDAKEAAGSEPPAEIGVATEQTTADAEAALRADSEERERLLGEFVRGYARLEPYIQRAGSRLRGEIEELDEDRQRLVVDWQEMFAPEIAALRQTRNAVVHQPELVSTETLRGAIINTGELSRILFDRIG
jgi:hypothetical protein